jgi:hypothetical protein
MKKLIILCLGFIFLFSVQAVPCSASFACADGSSISCSGDASCEAGIDFVVCTNQDGTFGSASC